MKWICCGNHCNIHMHVHSTPRTAQPMRKHLHCRNDAVLSNEKNTPSQKSIGLANSRFKMQDYSSSIQKR